MDIILEKRNIQILLETMTRCGGNCSGCALSSVERMDTRFDFDNFLHKTQLVYQELLKVNVEEVESITLFLGQGDHFLMSDKEIPAFMEACSKMIPVHLKSKTLLFITASAIGKSEQIKYKMDLFYNKSLEYEMPFFIQVVFDPKKININPKFKEIYINNILYFKEKCGMTEVTVNLGEDLLNYISPLEFHQWIKEYKFKHIEMNWVTNQFTYPMWKSIYNDMFSWLKQWLLIYKEDPIYEINFIPFLTRYFKKKELSPISIHKDITQTFEDNLYIDYQGQFFPSQMGMISNLTPFGQRIVEYHSKTPEQMSQQVIGSFLKKNNCMDCEFQSVCALSGNTSLFNYKENNHETNECPWNIKDFLLFFEKEIVNDERDLSCTIFDKNPVQSDLIKKDNNDTFVYFEETKAKQLEQYEQNKEAL